MTQAGFQRTHSTSKGARPEGPQHLRAEFLLPLDLRPLRGASVRSDPFPFHSGVFVCVHSYAVGCEVSDGAPQISTGVLKSRAPPRTCFPTLQPWRPCLRGLSHLSLLFPTRCTPDMDVTLSIPVEELLPF